MMVFWCLGERERDVDGVPAAAKLRELTPSRGHFREGLQLFLLEAFLVPLVAPQM